MATGSVIDTPRLQLIPFSKAFLTDRYIAWLNDPAVVRFSEQRFRQHTLESCIAYAESFAGDSPNFFWAITTRESSLHVGNICATLEPHHRVADIGILIGERSVWGQGLGHEAWCGVCDFLFAQAKVRKVTGGTLAANKGMMRIFEKSGMTEEGRRRAQQLLDGQPSDVVYFGILADEHRNHQRQLAA